MEESIELPEGCVSHIVSLTCPRDACRLSLVSTVFKSAAESDAVWDKFCPRDVQSVLSRSDTAIAVRSKKDLFLYLSRNHILIDGGKLSYSLDKWSGKKCYMLSAANLVIVWGDTPQYWKWVSLPDSRFIKVVELISVCWLEITGKISTSMLSPSTHYAAFFVFKADPAQLYGFNQPVEAEVGLFGSGNYCKRKVFLEVESIGRHRMQMERRFMLFRMRRHPSGNEAVSDTVNSDQLPKQRGDGWLEIELGDFYYVGDGADEGELEIRVLETKGGNWKGGIIVQGIEIRPKVDESMMA